MAITKTSSGISFDSFHFDAAEFDELLTQHGTPAELRTATRCGCWGESAPDPSCNLCYPFGYLYAAPRTLKVHGPNRKPMKRLESEGSIDLGDAMFSLPTDIQPPFYSRLTLPRSILTVDDTLRRGKEEILRFSRVQQVLGAHYAIRTPPTGSPYEVEHVPLVAGTDYVVDLVTRRVTWPGGSSVPDQKRVVFQCRVASEWILWDTQDRNEQGRPMPYRYLGKRLDYLLHPRGNAPERSF